MDISSPKRFGNTWLHLDPKLKHTRVMPNPGMTCDLRPGGSVLVENTPYSSRDLRAMPSERHDASLSPDTVVWKHDPYGRHGDYIYSRSHDLPPQEDARKLGSIQRVVSERANHPQREA